MSAGRIYIVTDTETNKHRLIRAYNQAQAIGYAARSRFDCEVASQDDLVSLTLAGIPVEECGKQEEASAEGAAS